MTKIIQCPSCSTKFAVQEAQIAGAKNPKFQCSRCQTVFALNSEPIEKKSQEILDLPEKNTKSLNDSSRVWSFGTTAKSEQLDLAFKNEEIKITKDEENISQISKEGFIEEKLSDQKLTGKIDKELINNLVYASSGSSSPVSVDWNDTQIKETKPTNRLPTEELPRPVIDNNDLNKLFKPGKQRLGNEEKIPEKSEITDPEVNSWSKLKNIISGEETKDEVSVPVKTEVPLAIPKAPSIGIEDINDLPISTIEGVNNISEDDPSNRSMKNTTVIKRDELEVEGFLKPEDDDDFEENFEIKNLNISPSIEKARRALSFRNLLFIDDIKVILLSSYFKSILIAWSVPSVILLLFYFYGKNLELPNKNSNKESFTIFSSVSDIVPPIGLSLISIRGELRPDINKNPMIIINGAIFNTTENSLYDPILETQTFDILNRLIKTDKFIIPNELNKSLNIIDLTKLDSEKINQLLKIRTWRELPPNSSIPFRVAIENIGKGYSYFGARIYSVKENCKKRTVKKIKLLIFVCYFLTVYICLLF